LKKEKKFNKKKKIVGDFQCPFWIYGILFSYLLRGGGGGGKSFFRMGKKNFGVGDFFFFFSHFPGFDRFGKNKLFFLIFFFPYSPHFFMGGGHPANCLFKKRN